MSEFSIDFYYAELQAALSVV